MLEPGDANETSSLPSMRLICWLGELTLSCLHPNVWAGTGTSKYLPCHMTLDLWFLRTVLGQRILRFREFLDLEKFKVREFYVWNLCGGKLMMLGIRGS